MIPGFQYQTWRIVLHDLHNHIAATDALQRGDPRRAVEQNVLAAGLDDDGRIFQELIRLKALDQSLDAFRFDLLVQQHIAQPNDAQFDFGAACARGGIIDESRARVNLIL
jgi:hypothetical protein